MLHRTRDYEKANITKIHIKEVFPKRILKKASYTIQNTKQEKTKLGITSSFHASMGAVIICMIIIIIILVVILMILLPLSLPVLLAAPSYTRSLAAPSYTRSVAT